MGFDPVRRGGAELAGAAQPGQPDGLRRFGAPAAPGQQQQDHRDDDEPRLAAIGPQRLEEGGDAAARAARFGDVAHQVAIGAERIAMGEAEGAQACLDAGAIDPRVGIDVRTGRFVKDRLDELGPASVEVVQDLPFGMEAVAGVGQALVGFAGDDMGIAHRMHGFLRQSCVRLQLPHRRRSGCERFLRRWRSPDPRSSAPHRS